MADNKKLLEDAIWEYISTHRWFKLIAIVVLSVGSLSGTITALDKPYRAAVDAATYRFGLRPNAEDVIFERNAFMSGMLFRELWLAPLTPESMKPNLDMLGKSLTAVGFGDAETKSLLNESPETIQRELLRIREKLEGHLETKGYRNKAFFNLGFHLRTLVEEATSMNQNNAVREINALVLKAYSSAQDTLPYRLPQLPLIEMKPNTPVPHDYIVSVIESIQRLKMFLSANA